jgi:hemerythrin-like domain-containing protein
VPNLPLPGWFTFCNVESEENFMTITNKVTGQKSTKTSAKTMGKKSAKGLTTGKVIKTSNQPVNIVDLILIDHVYLKECIKILKDEDADPREKIKFANGFMDALGKHSEAEKKILYATLEKVNDLHFDILEGEVEHGITDAKVKLLKPKFAKAKVGDMKEELGAEIKVLAELVEHHIKEEESEMLPKVKRDIDSSILEKLGAQFMKLRKWTEKDLESSPKLQTELLGWQEAAKAISSQFVAKVDKYIESLKQ